MAASVGLVADELREGPGTVLCLREVHVVLEATQPLGFRVWGLKGFRGLRGFRGFGGL